MATWREPKTDWNVNPIKPKSIDLNRIEENIQYLKDEVESKKGVIINALNDVGIDVSIEDSTNTIISKIQASEQPAKTYTPTVIKQMIPKGYHKGNSYVKGDSNLIGDNIIPGVSIFGVQGTSTKKLIAEGTASLVGINDLELKMSVSELEFKPKEVFVTGSFTVRYAEALGVNWTTTCEYGFINEMFHPTYVGGRYPILGQWATGQVNLLGEIEYTNDGFEFTIKANRGKIHASSNHIWYCWG